jgi:hypothetical protein
MNKVELTSQELFEVLASAAKEALETPCPFPKTKAAHIEETVHNIATKIVKQILKTKAQLVVK